MAEESGRPGTCRSNVGCDAIEEPCTNKMVAALLAGSPAHFSYRNSFAPPSLVVQCSSPLIGFLAMSFIASPVRVHAPSTQDKSDQDRGQQAIADELRDQYFHQMIGMAADHVAGKENADQ